MRSAHIQRFLPMKAQLPIIMSQVGSNLRLSQLHPLRPSHTDQSQGSISVETGRRKEGQKTKSSVEVGDPTGTLPKNGGGRQSLR
jgi:hypothetical protein